MVTTSQPRTGSWEEVTSRPLLFQLWSAGPKTKGRKNSSSVSSSKCSFINEKKFIAEESGSHFRGPQLEEDWRPSNLKLLVQFVSAQMSKLLRTSTEQQCFCPRLTSIQVPTTCAPRTLVSDTFFQAWQPLKQHQELHGLGRPHRAGETEKQSTAKCYVTCVTWSQQESAHTASMGQPLFRGDRTHKGDTKPCKVFSISREKGRKKKV